MTAARTRQPRWVLVCKGQPLDHEHVGMLFDSLEAAADICVDINLQTTDPTTALEVRKVWVKPIQFHNGFYTQTGWQLLGEAT